VLGFIRRYSLPVIFVTGFGVVSLLYTYGLGPAARQALVGWTATDLVNLKSDPLGSLISSAFVAEESPWVWLVVSVIALVPLVRRIGNIRALILVAAAQVLGSLISEGILGIQISMGVEPASMRFLDDVGPSYVMVAGLVAVILYTHGRIWRAGALACLIALAPHMFGGFSHLAVAPVGHTISMLVGAGLGWVFTRERVKTPTPQAATTTPRSEAEPEPTTP
jgi:hypothetical protein